MYVKKRNPQKSEEKPKTRERDQNPDSHFFLLPVFRMSDAFFFLCETAGNASDESR
jgi:hypothetical protein